MTGPEIDVLHEHIQNGTEVSSKLLRLAVVTLVTANEELQSRHAEAIEGWVETLAVKDKEIERLKTHIANMREPKIDSKDEAVEALVRKLADAEKTVADQRETCSQQTAAVYELRAQVQDEKRKTESLEGHLRAHRAGVLDDAVTKELKELREERDKLRASVIPDNDPLKSYDGIEDALVEVLDELGKAVGKNPRFNSYHEGWAVLFEEVDELWDEVREKRPNDAAMRLEARQVAAMALRFMVELVPPFEPTKDATT